MSASFNMLLIIEATHLYTCGSVFVSLRDRLVYRDGFDDLLPMGFDSERAWGRSPRCWLHPHSDLCGGYMDVKMCKTASRCTLAMHALHYCVCCTSKILIPLEFPLFSFGYYCRKQNCIANPKPYRIFLGLLLICVW